MLDDTLPYDNSGELAPDAEQYIQYAEEPRQLARLDISHQPDADARRYNLRR